MILILQPLTLDLFSKKFRIWNPKDNDFDSSEEGNYIANTEKSYMQVLFSILLGRNPKFYR